MNYFIVWKSVGAVLDNASDSECRITIASVEQYWTMKASVEQCRIMIASMEQCCPTLRYHYPALDSTSEHGMYSMGTIINYNLSDVTMTNYGNFLSLLMQ